VLGRSRSKTSWTLTSKISDDAVIARHIALEETMMHEVLKFDDDP
jgi:hypothetical protein